MFCVDVQSPCYKTKRVIQVQIYLEHSKALFVSRVNLETSVGRAFFGCTQIHGLGTKVQGLYHLTVLPPYFRVYYSKRMTQSIHNNNCMIASNWLMETENCANIYLIDLYRDKRMETCNGECLYIKKIQNTNRLLTISDLVDIIVTIII